MKLSMELYELNKRFGAFKGAEIAKEAGFDAIDYSYYWEMENEEILGDSYKEYAQNLKKHLDEIGIKCNQAHAPFSLAYGDVLNETNQKYLWLVHSIESAAILGASNIIVHSIKVPDDVDFVEYNLKYFRSLIPYCEKFGICVAVENLFTFDATRHCITGRNRLGAPSELNAFIDKLNSPQITACVDIGHASITGFYPEEFIAGMNPKYLKALHVQDTNYTSDSHVLPYTGELNWDAIMKVLKNIGYDGDFTFETTYFTSRFPDELLPEALKLSVAVGRHLISLYK